MLPFMGIGQMYNQYFDGEDTSYTNSIIVELDTSSTNVWQIGTPEKSIFDSAATQPYAIVTDTVNFYPVNNISRYRTKLFNTWGPFGILALQWMQKLDMDHDYDGGIVEFSIDEGVSWQNAFNNPYVYDFYGYDWVNKDTLISGDYAFSGTDSTWNNIWLCFDLSWMSFFPDTIHFRYTLMSDSVDNNKEGWLMDNMIAYFTWIHTINVEAQEEYMKVYPNLTSRFVNITTRKINDFHIIEHIHLINLQGRIVQEWGISPTKFYIDIGHHENGVYFLKVKTNVKTETFKVILQHD